ncbi:Jag N-terminal domain-containing protein, partial [Treponema pallidum]
MNTRFDQIRRDMQKRYEEDSKRVCVSACAKTLDKALEAAAVQLGIPKYRVEYEVLERGAGSFFSFRQKKWKIRA